MQIFLRICLSIMLCSTAQNIFAQTGEEALAAQYYQDREYESALQLYKKLLRKQPEKLDFILKTANCHTFLGAPEEGIKLLEKSYKKYPDEFILPLAKAELLRLSGETEKAQKITSIVITKELKTQFQFAKAAEFLLEKEQTDEVEVCYLQARKKLRTQSLFAKELATLYSRKREYGKATQEWISLYLQNPQNWEDIKLNILNLVEPNSKEEIEAVLLEAVNKRNTDRAIRELVFEFYVLSKDFYEAYIQAKSIDKVFQMGGNFALRYAQTLRNNAEFSLSNKMLDFVIETYPSTRQYRQALQEKVINSETAAFQKIPVDTAALREAVASYDQLLEELGRNVSTFDAIFRKAKLCSFYMNQLKIAEEELSTALKLPLQPRARAEAQLLLGDILLMQKEYSKATFSYDAVAKEFKDGQIGAMAKFKQGRLSYFKGDFGSAKARLASIKDNTTYDISNDAIQLFLLIQDNTGLDTTTDALQQFAQAQLLTFQREYAPALEALDSLLYKYPNHALTDEVLWEKAKIYIEKNNLERAFYYLDRLIDGYAKDIYGDDAIYTKAKIVDHTLKEKDDAIKLYMQLITQFPGSLYVVEARKRVRELRKSS